MREQPRIRVLVIDDSAFSRRSIVRMLERSPLVEVAGWAVDGLLIVLIPVEVFDIIKRGMTIN